ncbi:MAG: hypothetical protein RL376_706, partial [Verrucomicrobiota bacterium]
LNGGTMDSTTSGGFDFYDLNGTNTSVTTLANASASTIAGQINLRAGDGDTTGTVFTVADGAATDDLVVSALLANGTYQGAASVIQKSGPGRMVLSGANTYTGGTILNAGTLVAASSTALGATSTVTFNAGSGLTLELATPDGTLANPYTLNMGSNRFNTVLVNRATAGSADYTLGTLALGSSTLTFTLGANISGTGTVRLASLDLSSGNNDRPVILNGNATLAVGRAAILSNNTVSKRLQLDGTSAANTIGPIANGTGTGVLSLIKAGAGKWTLTGTNTYTGTTTVSAGELILNTPTLPSAASVSIATGATLNLAYTGTDIVGSLILNGVTQSAGTWGGLSSAAANKTALITGPGTLTVFPAAYLTWANTAALGAVPDQRGFQADPDADGLANSLEWVLGGNPSTNISAPLPQLSANASNYTYTFTRAVETINALALSAEWSTDLTTWNSITIGSTSSAADSQGVSCTVTPAPGQPDTIQITIPAANAPTARLFIRLKATL